MTNIKDGGPAFPVHTYDNLESLGEHVRHTDYGMTLRDYFAVASIQKTGSYFPGNIWQLLKLLLGIPYKGLATDCNIAATHAYKQADAMLKAREQGGAE